MSADLVTLLPLPAVAVCALAAIAAWLCATTRTPGVIHAPGKLFGVNRPGILAFLTGFLPAAILAAVLIPDLPGRSGIGLAAAAWPALGTSRWPDMSRVSAAKRTALSHGG